MTSTRGGVRGGREVVDFSVFDMGGWVKENMKSLRMSYVDGPKEENGG